MSFSARYGKRVMAFVVTLLVGLLCFSAGSFSVYAADSSSSSTAVGKMMQDSTKTYTFTVTKDASDSENGEAVLTSVSEQRQSDDSDYGVFIIPSVVKTSISRYNITAVGANAFSNVSTIKAVVLPDSIQSIDKTAFESQGASSQKISDIVVYCNDKSTAQSLAKEIGYTAKTDGISVTAEKTELTVGDTTTVKATLADVLSSESSDIKYSSSDTSVASVDDNGKITALKAGTTTVTAKVDGLKASVTIKVKADSDETDNTQTNDVSAATQSTEPTVTYQAHVKSYGWMDAVQNGKTAGTTGQSRRMEALKIKVSGVDNLGVRYRVHVKDKGWTDWASDGDVAGTTGKSLQAEAVQIELTGSAADSYDIYYRVHIKNFGWLAWTKNGDTAGSTGMGYRAEAIEIKLVKKGTSVSSTDGKSYAYLTRDKIFKSASVSYRSHVQNSGWQSWVSDGVTSGTTGKSLRDEAVQVKTVSSIASGGITYNSYVYKKGWQDWVSNGATSGTTGKGTQIQAVQLKLTGRLSEFCDIYYRVHVSNVGWMGWAKNGEKAGCVGSDNQIEAIQIKLVVKNGSAPGSTSNAYRYIQSTNYRERVISIANSQIGYSEINGWTKYGQWYQDVTGSKGFAYASWCAMFVSWCEDQAGVSTSIAYRHAYCPYGVSWYQSRGLYHNKSSYVPKAGDIVYYDWDYNGTADHVGFVSSYNSTNGYITTVEGNKSDAVGTRYVPSTWGYIHGYASPNY